MPIFNNKDAAAKTLYLSEDYIKKFPNKNPDASYNNETMEIECPSNSATAVKNAVRHGKEQSNFVLVYLDAHTSMNDARKWAGRQIKHYRGKKKLKVWLMNSKELVVLRTMARHKSR